MNSIWNKNIKAFSIRFSQLAEIYESFIKDFSECPEHETTFWKLSNAKDGSIIATENGLRLHSAYSPIREAQNLINNVKEKILNIETQNIVCYGFGLGYSVIELAKCLLENAPDKKLILVEPDYKHFFGSLLFLDWEDVFKLPNLIIAVSCTPTQFLPLIEDSSKINLGDFGVSKTYFFDIPIFEQHQKEYFDNIKALVERNLQKAKINAATFKKFGKLWIKNSLKNVFQMKTLPGINVYKDLAAQLNIPFLLIGAGPSLQNILPFLAQLKEKCIIVCVETALKILLKNNIEPDFVVLSDPQFWAYKHIEKLESLSSTLITEISVYPPVFRFKCKQIALYSSQFFIGQYLESRCGYLYESLGAGGSVASSAWNFCRLCGAKEIFTAGLDLSYPFKQTHIKGSTAEQTFNTVSNRLYPLDNLSNKSVFSADTKYQKNYLNQNVITDSRMEMFAWWFESHLANCTDSKTYTICPESLKIPFIEYIPVKDVLNRKKIELERQTFFKMANEKINKFLKGIDNNNKKIEKIMEDFPNKEFLTLYPFTKEYL